jgi:hypothetical protein
MDEGKISLDSDIGRGLVSGLVLGVILSLVDYSLNLIIRPWYLVNFVFLIVVGLISYKFVGSPVPGLILGVLTALVQELLESFLFGYTPFSWVEYMQYSWFVSETLPFIGISYVGFPAVGFLGGYVYQKRSTLGATSSCSVPLSNLESRVFEYIRVHNYQIQITDCALELGVDSASIRNALKSLEKKGKLKT